MARRSNRSRDPFANSSLEEQTVTIKVYEGELEITLWLAKRIGLA